MLAIRMRGGLCGVVLAAALMALGGCGGGAAAPLEAGAAGDPAKGRAVFYATMPMAACTNLSVNFSRKVADKYEPAGAGSLIFNIIASTNLASVDLTPGEYHVAGAFCMTANHSSFVVSAPSQGGGLFEKPTVVGTLGTFTVAAGEVVDIGSLMFLHASSDSKNQGGVILVTGTSPDRIAALKSANADVARRLVTRHARSAATDDQLRQTEERLTAAGFAGRFVELEKQQIVLPLLREARQRLRSASR